MSTLANAQVLAATPAAPAGAPVPPAPATPKKKSRKKLLVVAVVVLLVAGFVAKKEVLKPHYGPHQPVPLGAIDTLDQLTVNMADGHLVQVTLALQLTKVADSKAIAKDVPRFEDAAITILGEQTYTHLLAPAQRQAVRVAILRACQRIAGTVDGAATQISAVYFTGFILQ